MSICRQVLDNTQILLPSSINMLYCTYTIASSNKFLINRFICRMMFSFIIEHITKCSMIKENIIENTCIYRKLKKYLFNMWNPQKNQQGHFLADNFNIWSNKACPHVGPFTCSVSIYLINKSGKVFFDHGDRTLPVVHSI